MRSARRRRARCGFDPGCSRTASSSTAATSTASDGTTCSRTTGSRPGCGGRPSASTTSTGGGSRPTRWCAATSSGTGWRPPPRSRWSRTRSCARRPRSGKVVSELGEVPGGQRRRVGRFGIPEKYLHRIAAGQFVWAPHYIAQKTLMGLLESPRLTGNEQALEIVVERAARWFHRWLGSMTRSELDDLFDLRDRRHARALGRPVRHHRRRGTTASSWTATTGAACSTRCWPATTSSPTSTPTRPSPRSTAPPGPRRSPASSAGATSSRPTGAPPSPSGTRTAPAGRPRAELWTPPGELSARLGDTNQEHCTVYNMNRLADVPAAVDRRRRVRRLPRAQPLQRHPRPAAPDDGHGHLLPAAAGRRHARRGRRRRRASGAAWPPWCRPTRPTPTTSTTSSDGDDGRRGAAASTCPAS